MSKHRSGHPDLHTLEYLVDMAAELSDLANSAGCPTLAQLFKMANIEARTIADECPKSPSRSNSPQESGRGRARIQA
jgi:hypothetical protein